MRKRSVIYVFAAIFFILFILFYLFGVVGFPGLGRKQHIIELEGTDCKAEYYTYFIDPIPSSYAYTYKQALREIVKCLCENDYDEKIIADFVHDNSILLFCGSKTCSRLVENASGGKVYASGECTKDECFQKLKDYIADKNETEFYCRMFKPQVFY